MRKQYPVIVIGAGPVGLSAALALSEQGIDSLLIERNAVISEHPKARGLAARTMELFRNWKVEDEVRERELPESIARLTWKTDFQGELITHVVPDNSVFESVSPSNRALVSQDKLEEVLWKKVESCSQITSLKNHHAKVLLQNPDSVLIQLHNLETNTVHELEAQYVIVAEGAHSSTRKELGVEMEGAPKIGEHCSVYFRANLDAWLKEGPSALSFFSSERGIGKVLVSGNSKELWIMILHFDSQKMKREDFSPEACTENIRKALGIPDLPVEIKSIQFWAMSALVAQKFRVDRVFFAGDAAHCVPPTGGFGMNIGIQDAHNLAWKLAYVLKGFSSDKLLETYQEERKPIAHKIIEFSIPNNTRIRQIYQAAGEKNYERMRQLLDEQSFHVNSSGLDLGFVYQSSALAKNENAEEIDSVHYKPNSHPGSRAPHFWLDAGQSISSLDLFCKDYVFLTANSSGFWEGALEFLKMKTSIPLRLFRIDKHREDFLKAYGIGTEACVLVRPDGQVVKSWANPSEYSEVELRKILL